HRLAGDGRVALRLLGVDDLDLLGQPLDDAAIVALTEIVLDALDHGVADLVERVHLGYRLLVVPGDLEAGVVEGVPGAVAARQRQRRGLADMAHAERIDETLQRYSAPALDGAEQIAHRGRAVALDVLELEPGIALLQREDVGGLLHKALVE